MKSTILSVLSLAAIFSFASSASAGARDLKIFNTLTACGAETEAFMAREHLQLTNVECLYSEVSREYRCDMQDKYAANEQGAPLALSGKQARAVYKILQAAGAPSDNGMGKIFLSAQSILCTQTASGVSDIELTPAQRTSCEVNIEAPAL